VRVELLTMDGGNGTMSACAALAEALSRRGAACHTTDLMREANGLGHLLARAYNLLLSTDLGLASAYMGVAHAMPIDRVRAFNELSATRVASHFLRVRPDLVVIVSPWLSGMVFTALGTMRSRAPRVATVVVDLDEGAPRSWLDDRADLTVLPTEECADHLLRDHDGDARTEVIGMPVHREFCADLPSREEAKRRLGLNGRTVTVLGGREGGVFNLRLLEELRASDLGCELVMQCGANDRLRRRAAAMDGVRALGLVPSMRDLMLASDVVVTKPGALTVVELVTLRSRFVLNAHPAVMPQERGNVSFVNRHRLAPVCADPGRLPELVSSVLRQERPVASVDIAATEAIADRLVGLVGE